jgi:hypothetical protein
VDLAPCCRWKVRTRFTTSFIRRNSAAAPRASSRLALRIIFQLKLCLQAGSNRGIETPADVLDHATSKNRHRQQLGIDAPKNFLAKVSAKIRA